MVVMAAGSAVVEREEVLGVGLEAVVMEAGLEAVAMGVEPETVT